MGAVPGKGAASSVHEPPNETCRTDLAPDRQSTLRPDGGQGRPTSTRSPDGGCPVGIRTVVR